MRTALIAAAVVFAAAGCASVSEPETSEADPLPLVVDEHDHEAEHGHDDAGDATRADHAADGHDSDTHATDSHDTGPHDSDVVLTGDEVDIDPDVLAAMIVIVAGGDVDGAIEAGEFNEVDVLEALDLLADAQG